MTSTTTHEAKTAFEMAKSTYGPIIDNLNNLTWEQLSDEVQDFLLDNTWVDSAQVVLVLLVAEAVRGIDVDQVVETLGFAPRGPDNDEDDGWGPTWHDAFSFAT